MGFQHVGDLAKSSAQVLAQSSRRLANQVFFRKLYLDETSQGCSPKPGYQMRADLHYPFDELTDPAVAAAQRLADSDPTGEDVMGSDPGSVVACLNLHHLGWLTGLEPATLRTTI